MVVMKKMHVVAVGLLSSLVAAQPSNPLPFDPRKHFDKRCPPAVMLDNVTQQRDPTSTSSYLWNDLPAGSKAGDCAELCCHDWSCESFAFMEPQSPTTGSATGDWVNHDSLRGLSGIRITQVGTKLTVASLDTRSSAWSTATGVLNGLSGWLNFEDPSSDVKKEFLAQDEFAIKEATPQMQKNNRTFSMSSDWQTMTLERLQFDPPGFTQNFTAAKFPIGPNGQMCTGSGPCCIFKDDVDALVAGAPGVLTGVRSKLPSRPAPYPVSDLVSATLDAHFIPGINGDEFPITWGKDGHQYTGAGDNHQVNASSSPLSFFKVVGGPTEMNCTDPVTHHDQPSPVCTNVTMQGNAVPIKGPAAMAACPEWRSGIPNLKSSGVLSVDGVLYWAISCFNYGDDLVFNRQRYGPAWIVTSHDNGVTFNLTASPTDMFPGRLAAPRFIQYGQDFAGAPSDWVYIYFPGTTDDSAFFENNDEMLLGRVDKRQILNRSAYQFFNGVQLDGVDAWTSDSTIATPVWQFPLMTSVQQANYNPYLERYIFANWAWISYDGYPRPDHTADERNERTGHQRTQLTLIEAEQPWGPFKVFFQDDSWEGWDGSGGGYTPVIPPAWIGENDFWIVFTQCCGNFRAPLNHYNFNVQHVTLTRL